MSVNKNTMAQRKFLRMGQDMASHRADAIQRAIRLVNLCKEKKPHMGQINQAIDILGAACAKAILSRKRFKEEFTPEGKHRKSKGGIENDNGLRMD